MLLFHIIFHYLFFYGRIMRKPDIYIWKNKGADRNCAADQRLCFRYINRTVPLLPKFEALWLYSLVCVVHSLNPLNRFSLDEAHIFYKYMQHDIGSEINIYYV